jgi:fructose PTS system EIIBC or EIIC component
VSKDRFIGKKVLVVGVQEGIRRPEKLIRSVINGDAPIYKYDSKSTETSKTDMKENPIYRHLMNGVSFTFPFIVVGGLLIAIALTLGGEKTSVESLIQMILFGRRLKRLADFRLHLWFQS